MRNARLPALLLATVLQVLPILRTSAIVNELATPLMAILFRWAAFSAAAMGGIDSVSGASSGPTTTVQGAKTFRGTNGVVLKNILLTTSPFSSKFWTVDALPAGLNLIGKVGSVSWSIRGTPTESGVFNVLLTAKEEINSPLDRTATAMIVITIVNPVGVGVAPSVTSPPLASTFNAGQQSSFTVVASGTPPLTYFWTKAGISVSTATTSTGSNTFSIPIVSTLDAGLYSVMVSNAFGMTFPVSTLLTVNEPAAIGTPPQTVTVYDGESLTLSINATGTQPMTYQWFLNNQPVEGATGSNLTIPSSHSTNAGSYTVTAQNVVLTATSGAGMVSVVPLQLGSITPTVAGYRVDWVGLSNRSYVLETRQEASAGAWSAVGSAQSPQGGGPLSITVDSSQSGSPQFIRLKALP